MKKIKIGVMFILCLSCLIGCSGSKYNADIKNDFKNWISDEFLNNNKVRGAYYLNENYVEGVDDVVDKYIYDDQSPEAITLIFSEEEEFNAVFIDYPEEIDFTSQMVLIYIFPDVSSNEYKLDKVQLKDMKLTIWLKLTNSHNKDVTMPYQRCLIVIMDTIEVSSVIFNK